MIEFAEPEVTFDTRLVDELARIEGSLVLVPPERAARRAAVTAFDTYQRHITDQGGVRIVYRSQIAHPVLDVVRITLLVASTFGSIVGIALSSLSWSASFIAVIVLPIIAWWNIFTPIPITHCVEVHPDGLIVDGRFFAYEGFGEQWPGLQMQDDDPNRITFCGIYGSRFIAFASCNRANRLDRTPELLIEDLDLAMEQLWGRRDMLFPAAP